MLKSDRYSQPWSQANAAQFNESDEGGLNLGQVVGALRRRALLIFGVTAVVAGAAGLKAQKEPLVYKGSFEILTKPVTAESQVVANVPQTLSSKDGATSEVSKQTDTMIQVLQSPGTLAPVVEQLKTKYPKLDYDSLVKNLIIAPKLQNILEVGYSSGDEKQVRDVLDTIAKAYLDYSIKERRTDIDQAVKFVQERISEQGGLKDRVEFWQDKLLTFRRINNLVDPQQKAQEVSSQIASLTQQQVDNRIQLEQMIGKYQELQKELAQQPGERAGNSLLTENARYQRILDQIQALDIEIKKESARFTFENPAMESLVDKKNNLLPMLQVEEERVLREYQSRIQDLAARDKSLQDKIIYFNNYLKELATDTRDYDKIQQELKIANENLNQFLTKRQALQIEMAQKQQPWKLLNPREIKAEAFAVQGLSPNAKQNLALGAILGMLLGTGAALVVDKLSNVFYTAKDLKDATGLPLLGVVPLRKELATPRNSLMSPVGSPLFFEVFRSLYTNILLLGSDTRIRSLVISSATQADGKSTIAIQLAQAAAAMGKRVLLVDANLRFPCLHNRLGLMNIQGLTDVISQDLDWRNVIERSPQEENLYIMTAGPVPPDSIRLLASQKMQDLMSDLQSGYDLVIYDTPPLVGFADANLLAANTNGMVLVAGLGKVKRTLFQQALEELQVANTPILGMVANKSKDYNIPASYTYYQHYQRQYMIAERLDSDIDIDMRNSVPKTSVRQTRRK